LSINISLYAYVNFAKLYSWPIWLTMSHGVVLHSNSKNTPLTEFVFE